MDVDYQGVPHTLDPWRASQDRYGCMVYRRVGHSGLILPAISLGLWYNFGDNRPFDIQREVLRHAFDKGITHFDLANNYGPPYGAAEENFGRIMRTDFRPYRHELTLSTKAGWDMWPGPQGQLGSRNHLLSSLDASLSRLAVDYVDIFYSHRFDPETPLEETMGALASAVQSGKARYVGISSYSAEQTARAKEIAEQATTPLIIHQPAYNLFNRWIENELTDQLRSTGMGAIAFTALAQGLLTDRYAIADATDINRATHRPTLSSSTITGDVLAKLRGLKAIADGRGQSLAQMALAWVLRDPLVASTLIGASSVTQLNENVGALANLDFSSAELAAIDEYATDANINIWQASSEL